MEGDKHLQSSMEHISKVVENIQSDTGHIREELVRNEEWHNVLNEKVADMHLVIYGNGKTGLKEQIASLDHNIMVLTERVGEVEACLDEDKKDEKVLKLEWLRGWRAVFFTVITTILTVGITQYIVNTLFH